MLCSALISYRGRLNSNLFVNSFLVKITIQNVIFELQCTNLTNIDPHSLHHDPATTFYISLSLSLFFRLGS